MLKCRSTAPKLWYLITRYVMTRYMILYLSAVSRNFFRKISLCSFSWTSKSIQNLSVFLGFVFVVYKSHQKLSSNKHFYKEKTITYNFYKHLYIFVREMSPLTLQGFKKSIVLSLTHVSSNPQAKIWFII